MNEKHISISYPPKPPPPQTCLTTHKKISIRYKSRKINPKVKVGYAHQKQALSRDGPGDLSNFLEVLHVKNKIMFSAGVVGVPKHGFPE